MDAPVGQESGGLSALDSLLKRTVARDLQGASRWSAPPAVRSWALLGLGAAVLAVVAGWGAWHLVARPAPIEERMPMASRDTTSSTDGTDAPDAAAPTPEVLVVHVAGAVLRPGLVELPAGARVADAVGAAGGVSAQVDHGRLNLAAPVVDGARVYVPAVGEQVPAELAVEAPVPPGSPSAGSDGGSRVNVNSAGAAELESLPGIGPATAGAIIEHRERNGPFGSVDGLLEVRGIGEAKLEALLDHVAVG
jgi:competence protein ComEA